MVHSHEFGFSQYSWELITNLLTINLSNYKLKITQLYLLKIQTEIYGFLLPNSAGNVLKSPLHVHMNR